MKKLLAILLAMMLVMVSAVALATDVEENNEEVTETSEQIENVETNEEVALRGGNASTLTEDYQEFLNKKLVLNKQYTITNGTAPAETFTFRFTGVSYKNGAGQETTEGIPAIPDQTISFTDAVGETTNASFELDFDLNNYNLGIYTYKIEEVIPTTKTAGVTYQEDDMYLVLTVLSEGTANKSFVAALHKGTVNGTKAEAVQNSYNAGTLVVEKETTGNLADLEKPFTFTIAFTAAEGTQVTDAQKTAINITGATGTWGEGEERLTYTVDLKHGDTVTFSNLPAGISYAVSEDYEEYNLAAQNFSDNAKKIDGGDNDTVKFTNTLDMLVDTGVSMDSVPYMVLMAIALIGGAVLFLRKREEY